MKSLAKPRYTQEQYDQASAVYMRWCYVQALREGRPVPSKQAPNTLRSGLRSWM